MQKVAHKRDVGSAMALAVAVFFCDFFTKRLVFGRIVPLGPSWLSFFIRLTDHRNFGLTFDLPVPRTLLIVAHVLILLFMLVLLLRARTRSGPSTMLAFGLIMGGALGNLYDRVFFGYVRDWLLLFGRSAINLADIAIAFGVIFFAIALERNRISSTTRPEPTKPESFE